MAASLGRIEDARSRDRFVWGSTLAVSTALVLLAYGGVLDNYFFEIDDGKVLNGVVEGVHAASPRFLPVHFAWLRLLHRIFGVEPAGYYLSGLILHALSAATVGVLVHRLTRRIPLALCGVAVFSVLYAPREAVLWITANCGLLSVLFVLLATLAWDVFLVEGRRREYWIAIACAILAMGSKEDSILLAPMFLGLDRLRRGPSWSHGFLRRYAVLIALGLAYLVVSLRPELWAGSHIGVGYDVRLELLPKLVSNYAILFWPRHVRPDQAWTWALPAGLLILLILAAAAWVQRRASPLIAYGLLVSVCGLLPVLPGPFRTIAQQRYAYPSAMGAAFLAAGIALALENAVKRCDPVVRRRARAAGLLVLVAWTTVQVLAIRSSERWQFERKCVRFENAMNSTKSALLEARALNGPPVSIRVLEPQIWDPYDYALGLHALAALPTESIELRLMPIPEVLERLGEEKWLSNRAIGVWIGHSDGSISPARRIEDLPVAEWERIANGSAERGPGRPIAVVTITAP